LLFSCHPFVCHSERSEEPPHFVFAVAVAFAVACSPLPPKVTEQIKKQIVSMVPANELGRSEHVAKAASFLASNDGRFIRGIELFVDSGMASV